MPAGRPTDYKSAYCELALAHGADGKTYTAIASAIGTSRQTLYSWMDNHPEFLDAMKASRELAMAWWEDRLQGMAVDGKGNATAAIFAMKNQFPDDYRDRREHQVDATIIAHEIDFRGFDDESLDEDEPEG